MERAKTRAPLLPGDFSDETSVRAIVERAVGKHGRIDELVDNAGVSLVTPADETSLSDWRRVLERIPNWRGPPA
jgi:NAD(P)-dependent dehydrogenase (short-subunit alcohol dehydrogenase family)